MTKLFMTMFLFYVLSIIFIILHSFIGTLIPIIFIIFGTMYMLYVIYNELIYAQNDSLQVSENPENEEFLTENGYFLFIE